MIKIDILTLFPEMFNPFIKESIIGRAIKDNKVSINIINIRDFSKEKNKQVDDYSFGGNGGMVLMCEPVVSAIESVKKDDSLVIMMSPKGKKYTQEKAKELKNVNHLILVCGHYEGFDERIRNFIDEEISIGDYVLTGGELPAMVICDSVIRLIDGVITKTSLDSESFNDNLLDYPVYTKPRVFRNLEVPEVLLNGNHEKIKEYRESERIRLTKERRNDLLSEEEK